MSKIALRRYNTEINDMIDHEEVEEAIAHCLHILNIYPKYVETYRLLGKAYLESKQFENAADVFQRVLSSHPDDFVANVGMSIIGESYKDFDSAIHFMERAFEEQPSNHAIQEEMKRLFSRRDGVEPTKVRLTRGALARMYVHGNLYDQAVAELLSIINESPQRLDLLTILAETYYVQSLNTEAADVCMTVLNELPYCYLANRIMYLILTQDDRTDQAQEYFSRWIELDPYAEFISPPAYKSEDISDNTIEITKLELEGEQEKGPELTPIEEKLFGLEKAVDDNGLEEEQEKKPKLTPIEEQLFGLEKAEDDPVLEEGFPKEFVEEPEEPPFLELSDDEGEMDVEEEIPEWLFIEDDEIKDDEFEEVVDLEKSFEELLEESLDEIKDDEIEEVVDLEESVEELLEDALDKTEDVEIPLVVPVIESEDMILEVESEETEEEEIEEALQEEIEEALQEEIEEVLEKDIEEDWLTSLEKDTTEEKDTWPTLLGAEDKPVINTGSLELEDAENLDWLSDLVDEEDDPEKPDWEKITETLPSIIEEEIKELIDEDVFVEAEETVEEETDDMPSWMASDETEIKEETEQVEESEEEVVESELPDWAESEDEDVVSDDLPVLEEEKDEFEKLVEEADQAWLTSLGDTIKTEIREDVDMPDWLKQIDSDKDFESDEELISDQEVEEISSLPEEDLPEWLKELKEEEFGERLAVDALISEDEQEQEVISDEETQLAEQEFIVDEVKDDELASELELEEDDKSGEDEAPEWMQALRGIAQDIPDSEIEEKLDEVKSTSELKAIEIEEEDVPFDLEEEFEIQPEAVENEEIEEEVQEITELEEIEDDDLEVEDLEEEFETQPEAVESEEIEQEVQEITELEEVEDDELPVEDLEIKTVEASDWVPEIELEDSETAADELAEEVIDEEVFEEEVSPVELEPVKVEEFDETRKFLQDGDLSSAGDLIKKVIRKGKNLPEVIEVLEEGLTDHPIDVNLWQLLGDAFMRQDKLAEAMEAYTNAEDLLR